MSDAVSHVEVLENGLIIIHDLIVDYDQPPAEAILGLSHVNSLIANFSQELWVGGKAGKHKLDVPLLWPGRAFSTEAGRELQQKIGYGLPAELAAIKDEEIRQILHSLGISEMVVFGESDAYLWQDTDLQYRYVYLDTSPNDCSFRLGYAAYDIAGARALIGSPV